MLDERPGVDALEADDVVGLEVLVQRRIVSPVAGVIAVFLDDETRGEDFSRFPVRLVRAVVADQGIGHRDDLLVVRGIGEDFLVAGHARIEDDFPARLAHGAERGAFKHPAVFQ